MNVERRLGRLRVGGWDFDPATGELRRGPDLRRLEPRAAKALELLCEARGGVVTQEQLIAQVWNGRSLSENSVAVVIGQLRRALDDDARQPRLIETIPKRGYRLVDAPGSGVADRRRGWLVAALLAAVASLGLLAAVALNRPTGTPIAISDVVNETGERAYDPLARATSELIVNDLAERGFAVRRSDSASELRLSSKLVMWNGAPYLGMTATDREGVVRWSAMIPGTADRVPAGVDRELDRLKAELDPN